MKTKSLVLLGMGLGFMAGGCATTPVTEGVSPEKLMALACEPGIEISEVKGSVLMRAKSKEASGQFPALVQVKDQGKLNMEVTNLLGGTEARIEVQGSHYTINVPGQKSRSKKGYGTWGGIPLNFASQLFLGRVPCPSPKSRKMAQLELDDEGRLQVTLVRGAKTESYLYTFRNNAGQPWPEALLWQVSRGKKKLSVEFKFDKPEDGTLSPLRWVAQSTRGEVKLRWRDRKVAKRD